MSSAEDGAQVAGHRAGGGAVRERGAGLLLAVRQRREHLLHRAQHRGQTHQVPQLRGLLANIRHAGLRALVAAMSQVHNE